MLGTTAQTPAACARLGKRCDASAATRLVSHYRFLHQLNNFLALRCVQRGMVAKSHVALFCLEIYRTWLWCCARLRGLRVLGPCPCAARACLATARQAVRPHRPCMSLHVGVSRVPVAHLCVPVMMFITAGPMIKLCAGGRGTVKDVCHDDEPRHVWTSGPITH